MSATRSRRPPRTPELGVPLPLTPSLVSVLALDPAPGHTGVVALDPAGVLVAWACWRPKGDIGERLTALKVLLSDWIGRLAPGMVVWENGRGPHPAPQLDVLEGALARWCREAGIPVERQRVYMPQTWRAEVLGRGMGRLPKEAVLETLRRLYPAELATIPDKEQDVLEAWGVARCYWQREGETALGRLLAAAAVGDAGAVRPAVERVTRYGGSN